MTRRLQSDQDSQDDLVYETPTRAKPAGKIKLVPTRLRIVAGDMGGRKIDYNGDPATRPMKERTREAVFSLLGGYLYDTFAIDLFGGTGILAFESISRGAEKGIILEMSRTAVATILTNMQHLKIADRIDVFNVDTLRWLRNLELVRATWPKQPWVVFCCPPYKMWTSDRDRLCDGISQLFALSPSGSQFVCEAEEPFDLAAAMPAIEWDIRSYSPTSIGVSRKA